MNYLSLCSGIEAASVAWNPLGWRAVGFSEIEKFPCDVLGHHYPDVPNFGDMTKFKEWPHESIDLLVGGTPCQSFSVAGLRKGMDDPRGNLALVYLAIAAKYQPKWLVWENVPGVLSSNKGRDFGSFVGGLAKLGYGFAYRVLDAQYVRTDGYPYAVPQRRRRVFVVGCLGDWRSAAAVLFDQESVSGNPAPRREKGEEVAPTLTRGFGDRGVDSDQIANGGYAVQIGSAEVSKTLMAGGNKQDPELESYAIAIAGNTINRKPENGGNGTGYDESGVSYTLTKTDQYGVVYGWNGDATPKFMKNIAPCMRAGQGGEGYGVFQNMRVRRLMPIECARLQGFPEYEKYIEAEICYLDHQKSYVSAETKNHRLQKSASNVAGKQKHQNANTAESNLLLEQGLKENHVALNVRLILGRLEVQLHSPKKCQSSASGAENQKWFHLPMLTEDFAQLLALTARCLAKVQLLGGGEQQQRGSYSIHHVSGKLPFYLSGKEIEEYAKDVRKSTNMAKELSMCITLETTHSIQALEQKLATLYCYVLGVIVGCIPEKINITNLSKVTLKTKETYLSQVKGASDSKMYKALGNSMAVNVMQCIGERIQMMEGIH